MKKIKQEGQFDCGISCLLWIIRYYKGNVSVEWLKEETKLTKNGTTFYNLSNVLNSLGLKSSGYFCNDYTLLKDKTPVIVQTLINKDYYHFVVVTKIKDNNVYIMDPIRGNLKLTKQEFLEIWTNNVLVIQKDKPLVNIKNINYIKETIISIIKTNKTKIFYIYLLALLYTIISLISSYYFKLAYDNLSIINQSLKILIIFSFLGIINSFILYWKNKMLYNFEEKIDYQIIMNVLKHIIFLPYMYFKNRNIGEIISRINDLGQVKNVVSQIMMTILIDSMFILMSLFVLIFINKILVICLIGFILLELLLSLLINNKMINYIDNNQTSSAYFNHLLLTSLSTFESLKGTNREAENIVILENEYKKYQKNTKTLFSFNNKTNSLRYMLSNIYSVVILGLGCILIGQDKLEFGNLLLFYVLSSNVYEQLKSFLMTIPNINDSLNAIKRINNLLQIKKEFNLLEYKSLNNSDIQINNLSFSYDGYEEIFKIDELFIKSGTKLLIKGKSGCGKSTFLKILMKYYKISDNTVYLKQDINELDIRTIRQSISYINQKELLENKSIYDNLCYYGQYDMHKIEKVIEIIDLANLEIYRKYGLNYLIEENGFNLSGGTIQRIIIGRHLLLNRKIMLFDEAFNAMDNETERKILEQIFKCYPNTTMLIVSHHHENIDLYDGVYDFERKKLIYKEEI